MTTAEAIPLRFDMGRVASRTFGTIGRNFAVFALLAVVLTGIPQGIVGYFSLRPGSTGGPPLLVTFGASLVGFIAASVLQAAVVHGVVADLNGRKAAFGDCLSTGLRFLLPVIGISILAGLAVGVGLVLLIIPGLWLVVTWCVNVPVVVLERKPVFEAFRRSADLTRHHRGAILGLVLAYFIVAIVIQRVGVAVTGGLSLATLGAVGFNTPQYVVVTVISVITSLVGAAGVAAIYYELRSIKEGVGPEALASVFD